MDHVAAAKDKERNASDVVVTRFYIDGGFTGLFNHSKMNEIGQIAS